MGLQIRLVVELLEKSAVLLGKLAVGGTRSDTRLRTGLSPRGSLTLYRTAQARARTEGRDFVTPEDIRALAIPVLAHRMQLDSKAKYAGQTAESILREALETLPVPR